MDMCRYFLCFAVFSFIGWAYESAYYTLQQRRLVNSGFLNGCCCPIYGIGALLDLMLLSRIENPFRLFLAGMILTCALEYFVSWLLEVLFKRRWWDYTNWPLNIHGRVSIISGAVFGLLSVALIKFIAPQTFIVIESLSDNAARFMAAAVAVGIVIDLAVTVRNSDSFSDKLWYVGEQAKIFGEDGFGGRIMAGVGSHISGLHPIKGAERHKDEIIEKIRRFFKR